LDDVGQGHSAVTVLARKRHDKPRVSNDHQLPSFGVPRLGQPREPSLFLEI
jgi:hypothetical protein